MKLALGSLPLHYTAGVTTTNFSHIAYIERPPPGGSYYQKAASKWNTWKMRPWPFLGSWALTLFPRDVFILNFLTFSKYKKTKFRQILNQNLLPQPPSEGVLKKWKFSKLVIEPKLLNMIYRTHKKRNKSKIWALYLKNWASYGNFCESRKDKISETQIFQISISRWIFEIGA